MKILNLYVDIALKQCEELSDLDPDLEQTNLKMRSHELYILALRFILVNDPGELFYD
jgi:hypothetical protein